jgi:hypothetical protein
MGYTAPNDGMINEQRTGSDMKGSGRGLIQDTTPAFDWRN